MKRSPYLKAVLFLAMACMFSSLSRAQTAEKKPVPSPRDSISGLVHNAMISINYGSPSVRGRKIYDSLVPYHVVWRVGANEATRFSTDKSIKVKGKMLPAGTYGLFAIPDKKKWIIIFNSVPYQWGAFKYDSTKDVLRVVVKAKKAPMHERLYYDINKKGFALEWEKVMVPVKIRN